MPQELVFIYTVGGLLASLLVTISFRRWRKSKGKASIFAQDDSFEDVGLSVLSALFPSRAATEDFRTVLRPPWGLRLGAPVLAAVFLVYVDLTPLVESLSWATPEHGQLFKAITGVFLAYSTIMLLFFQRIVYDKREIRSYGMDLRPQTRDLSGLIRIEVHPSRPALVMTFDDQPHLYIPKFLSQRDQFIREMNEVIARNGLHARPDTTSLRYRLGL